MNKNGSRESLSWKTLQWSFKGGYCSSVLLGMNHPNLGMSQKNNKFKIELIFNLPAGPSCPTSMRPHWSTKLDGGIHMSNEIIAVGICSWLEVILVLKGLSSRPLQLNYVQAWIYTFTNILRISNYVNIIIVSGTKIFQQIIMCTLLLALNEDFDFKE